MSAAHRAAPRRPGRGHGAGAGPHPPLPDTAPPNHARECEMLKQNISCRDCVHWEKPAEVHDDTVAVCRLAGDAAKNENEDVWKEKIPRIKLAVAERAPHYADRVDNLASLLSYLQDYHEAVLASIEGYDAEDEDAPDSESAFGDSTMEEFISLIRSLPTIPADIPRRIRRQEADGG